MQTPLIPSEVLFIVHKISVMLDEYILSICCTTQYVHQKIIVPTSKFVKKVDLLLSGLIAYTQKIPHKFCAMEFYVSSIYSREDNEWHPTPVLLPGKSHGWRSLVGCSPWGR